MNSCQWIKTNKTINQIEWNFLIGITNIITDFHFNLVDNNSANGGHWSMTSDWKRHYYVIVPVRSSCASLMELNICYKQNKIGQIRQSFYWKWFWFISFIAFFHESVTQSINYPSNSNSGLQGLSDETFPRFT